MDSRDTRDAGTRSGEHRTTDHEELGFWRNIFSLDHK
jgi:hypothetical protein